MAIVKCPNGHKYNSDLHKRCPNCGASNEPDEWDEYLPSDIAEGEDSGAEPTEPLISHFVDTEDDSNDDFEPTRYDDFGFGKADDYQRQPVVGWLVCIEGPDKGRDFVLHGAKSTIGRHRNSSVCLSDNRISREGFPALIVYDDRKSHRFYLASGDAASHNNVELRGEMLLGQSVLNAYDEIRIEDSVLVFVPFCGDDFYWKD